MSEILTGDLTILRLIDILRVLHQHAKTGRLQLAHRAELGEIYLVNGNIVHAQYGEQSGEDAVYTFLAWSQGKYLFSPSGMPPAANIHATTHDILARGEQIDRECEILRDGSLDYNTHFRPTRVPHLNGGQSDKEPDHLSTEATVDPRIFEVIQWELTRVLGPIAPFTLDEQIERMGESRHYFPKARLAELAELLSLEIPKAATQVRFQQAMVELLKKIEMMKDEC